MAISSPSETVTAVRRWHCNILPLDAQTVVAEPLDDDTDHADRGRVGVVSDRLPNLQRPFLVFHISPPGRKWHRPAGGKRDPYLPQSDRAWFTNAQLGVQADRRRSLTAHRA